ncbi:hypothetical protein QTN25_007254 [Entamoeba marina]
MSQRVKQLKEKNKNAEIKRESIGSIHRRIITIAWILIKRFGYEIEINKEKRIAKLTFPYYLISKIKSKEGNTLFDSNELSKKFQKRVSCNKKKQLETNCIKKKLNNKLIKILKSLGFFVKTKLTKTMSDESLKKFDKKTIIKIDYICYNNKKYDMNLVEKLIGDEANKLLKDFFKENSGVKCATFRLSNENVIESSFTRNNKVVVIPTKINPFDQLQTIQSIPINENLNNSIKYSQQQSCTNNTIKIVEQEQGDIENITQNDITNEINKFWVYDQINYENEMCQQSTNQFTSCYCHTGTIYDLTPTSCNQNIPNLFLSIKNV